MAEWRLNKIWASKMVHTVEGDIQSEVIGSATTFRRQMSQPVEESQSTVQPSLIGSASMSQLHDPETPHRLLSYGRKRKGWYCCIIHKVVIQVT